MLQQQASSQAGRCISVLPEHNIAAYCVSCCSDRGRGFVCRVSGMHTHITEIVPKVLFKVPPCAGVEWLPGFSQSLIDRVVATTGIFPVFGTKRHTCD